MTGTEIGGLTSLPLENSGLYGTSFVLSTETLVYFLPTSTRRAILAVGTYR